MDIYSTYFGLSNQITPFFRVSYSSFSCLITSKLLDGLCLLGHQGPLWLHQLSGGQFILITPSPSQYRKYIIVDQFHAS